VNILQPGPGVGGHCIAVDPWFIVDADPENARLIRTAREVNDGKPEWVVGKVKEAVESVATPKIAALGLAFKADIDDLRESPARRIAARLADELPEGTILAVEPHVAELPKELANRRNVVLTDLEDALRVADVIVALVDHSPFKEHVAALQGAGVPLIDTRGITR
jgi:UDP-N-acetyl-D-mannosaminuronic acid dehydrogenase